MSPPIAPERVLPTLNADGTRFLIRPRLYPGKIYRKRRIVAWVLMALFIALPFLRVGGKPAMLLDIAERHFIFFGHTFLATDGVLLMFFMLAVFASVFLVTALVGRGFCGWACPQTVYMEFLFRPIERLFEGKREDQLRLDRAGLSARRVAKNGVFLLLSVALGNIFLAYFVGVDRLAVWMRGSPLEHSAGFLTMAVTSALVFFDFAFFREQMCTVICPYARLQSVLLDRRSLVVGYDVKRGEPRSKGKPKPGNGDCIDCSACVVACPTGIDIRKGLQLECIACAQCVDACDSIMGKIKKPSGLIRYGSQDTFETGKKARILRPRVLIYAGLLSVLIGALAVTSRAKQDCEVTVLRGVGAPFTQSGDDVTNLLRLKIQNRDSEPHRYSLELLDAPGARVIAPELPLQVPGLEQRSTGIFVVLKSSSFANGERRVRLRVRDEAAFSSDTAYKLLGPALPSGGSP